jgi:membrane associated rhomboid family serine protease
LIDHAHESDKALALSKRFWSILLALSKMHGEPLLLSLSDHEARFSLHDGRLLAVVLVPDEVGRAWLNDWLVRLKSQFASPLDILVVSNNILSRELPVKRPFSFYQINEKGELWMGEHASNRSPIVAVALQQAEDDDLHDFDIDRAKEALQVHHRASRASVQEMVHFQDRFAAQRYSMVVVLTCLVLGMFALEELWGGSQFPPTLYRMGANSRSHVWAGEVWRLMTSIFLHGGYLHVFCNTYVLIALGVFFNRLFGGAKFLILFLFSGLMGSVASVLLGSAELSVGASGALWGLFGASAALILRPSSFLPEIMRARMKRLTLVNLAINLGISFLPSIDFWAHIGGGVAGFVVGLIYVRTSFVRKPLAIALTAMLVVSFVMAAQKGRPWLLTQPLSFQEYNVGDKGWSLEIPTLLTGYDTESAYGKTSARFGELPFDPMVIGFEVTEVAALSDEPEQLRFLYGVAQAFSTQNRLEVLVPARHFRADGYLTVTEQLQSGRGERILVWFQLREHELVRLEVVLQHDAPDNFMQGAQRIFDSLKSAIRA